MTTLLTLVCKNRKAFIINHTISPLPSSSMKCDLVSVDFILLLQTTPILFLLDIKIKSVSGHEKILRRKIQVFV